jgi:hypothetical protein
MKKKLEAELISIAHRILKLKNRAELEQLQEETLKLYEKLSVLKFVEDNFNDVKPTIGFAMAEEKLDEIYSPQTPKGENEEVVDKTPSEETQVSLEEVKAEETTEAESKEEVTPEATEETEAETPVSEEVVAPEEEAEVAEPAQEETEQTQEPVAEEKKEDTDTDEVAVSGENTTEEVTAVAPEKEETTETEETPAIEIEDAEPVVEEATDEPAVEEAEDKEEEKPAIEAEPVKHLAEQPVTHHREEITAEVGLHEDEQQPITEIPEMPEVGALPENSGEDTENGTGEGIDIPTGEPAVSQEEAVITEETTGTEINFERKEPAKQREIVFEDFSKFIEPEFVKKTDEAEKAPETLAAPITPAPTFDDWMNWEPKKEDTSAPTTELPKEEPKPVNPLDDWMNWEPSKAVEAPKPAEPELPKEEPKATPVVEDWRNWEPSKPAQPEPVKEAPKAEPAPSFIQKTPEAEPAKPAAPRYSDTFVRAMSLGLNDRIAFEKHLFGGSSEDLNRVVSQINTLNSFEEAQDFITDLVKPDYNNWNGKEEYEARFMELVEKKFR